MIITHADLELKKRIDFEFLWLYGNIKFSKLKEKRLKKKIRNKIIGKGETYENQ